MAKAAARREVRVIAIADHPVYPMVLPVPIVCFLAALLTDLAYWNSGGHLTWLYFSTWLIPAGLVFGGLAILLALVDLSRTGRLRRGGWPHLAVLLAAWLVELISAFIHQRDGWTAVMPTGLILSVIGAVLILASGWLWQSLRYRARGDFA